MKPIEERLAEAEAFRSEVTAKTFYRITRAIRESAIDCGEIPPPEKRPLQELTPETPADGQLSVREIQSFVASYFNISVDDILSHNRQECIHMPRKIAMYITRKITSNSYPMIGYRFYRDHTTVIYSVRKIRTLIKKDKSFAAEIAILMEKLTDQ